MKNMIFTEDEARCVVEVLKEKSGAIHDVLQKVNVHGHGGEKAVKCSNIGEMLWNQLYWWFHCDFCGVVGGLFSSWSELALQVESSCGIAACVDIGKGYLVTLQIFPKCVNRINYSRN